MQDAGAGCHRSAARRYSSATSLAPPEAPLIVRARQFLILTLPATLAVGWTAYRDVDRVKTANASAIVATFPASHVQRVALPSPGTYWVFFAADKSTLAAARRWTPSMRHDSTGVLATIVLPDSARASRRRDQAALDLLFTFSAPVGGAWSLGLVPDSVPAVKANVRITRSSASASSAAVRAFGLATLFSLLLVVNAILWFRGGN